MGICVSRDTTMKMGDGGGMVKKIKVETAQLISAKAMIKYDV